MSKTRAGSPLRRRLLIVAALIAAVLIFVKVLPQGFSQDLSRIGKGTAVAVLLDYRFSVQSQEMMTLLNEVRADYDGRLEFLVLDADSEQGRAFAAAHGAGGAILVLFGPDGAARGVVREIDGEQDLRQALQPLLATTG